MDKVVWVSDLGACNSTCTHACICKNICGDHCMRMYTLSPQHNGDRREVSFHQQQSLSFSLFKKLGNFFVHDAPQAQYAGNLETRLIRQSTQGYTIQTGEEQGIMHTPKPTHVLASQYSRLLTLAHACSRSPRFFLRSSRFFLRSSRFFLGPPRYFLKSLLTLAHACSRLLTTVTFTQQITDGSTAFVAEAMIR